MVKSRRGDPKNHYNNYRRFNFRGSSVRGRNNYYSRRGYSPGKYFHNNRWERISSGQGSGPIPRPLSPVEGSEEFMARKIELTSAIIMRQLLSPNEPLSPAPKLASKNDEVGETLKLSENKEKQNEKGPSKTRKTSATEINVKEIHDKIMSRLTNLNEGRKKNFINAHAHNTSLDSAIQHIQKQKRLELSRVLRDMCSSSQNIKTSGILINSIIPDIGIKLEELPIDVIQELSKTLNLDLDEDILDSTDAAILDSSGPAVFDSSSPAVFDSSSPAVHEPASLAVHEPASPAVHEPASPAMFDSASSVANTHISSDQLIAAIDSIIQVKSEQDDNFGCSGSVEIKPEDIADYDSADYTQSNFEVCEPSQAVLVQESENAQQIEELSPLSICIKEESLEDNECRSTASNFSDVTAFFHGNNSRKEPSIDKHNKCNDILEQNEEVVIPSPIDFSNNANNNKRTDETSSGQTEDSLISLFNFMIVCLGKDDALDVNDLNLVSKHAELADKLVKYVLEYKQNLFKSVVDRCYEIQSLNQTSTCISLRCNDSAGSSSQSSHSIQNIATMEDQDKRATKRRKVETKTQETDEIKKEQQSDNEVLEEQDLLTFPELKDRVMVIEKVDNQLVLATELGNIIYVSLKDGSFLHTIDVASSPITSLIFSKGINEFRVMYVGTLDNSLRIYDFESRNMIKATPLDDHIRCMDAMWDYVFMGCRGGTLIRYSTMKGRIEFEERNTGADILVIKAAQEGPRRVLLVGHKQAPIYVRDAMSGLYLRNFSNEAISPTVYALIVNKNHVYCGTARSNILVFSFHEGFLIHKLFAEDCKGISCMAIYKDLLISGCYNGSIYIYSLKLNKLLRTLKGPGGSISCMKVLSNQVIVGTHTGNFGSITVPVEVYLNS